MLLIILKLSYLLCEYLVYMTFAITHCAVYLVSTGYIRLLMDLVIFCLCVCVRVCVCFCLCVYTIEFY